MPDKRKKETKDSFEKPKFVPVHKHIIVSALVNKPPSTTDDVKEFLSSMISKVGMECISGPYAEMVEDEGNEAPTGVAILSTSHCAVHVWTHVSPARMEVDLYSCKDFNPTDIVKMIKEFDAHEIKCKFLDRDVDV